MKYLASQKNKTKKINVDGFLWKQWAVEGYDAERLTFQGNALGSTVINSNI